MRNRPKQKLKGSKVKVKKILPEKIELATD